MREGFRLNLAPFRKDYPLTAIEVGRHKQQLKAFLLAKLPTRQWQPCPGKGASGDTNPQTPTSVQIRKSLKSQRCWRAETLPQHTGKSCSLLTGSDVNNAWGLRSGPQLVQVPGRCRYLPFRCQLHQVSRGTSPAIPGDGARGIALCSGSWRTHIVCLRCRVAGTLSRASSS